MLPRDWRDKGGPAAAMALNRPYRDNGRIPAGDAHRDLAFGLRDSPRIQVLTFFHRHSRESGNDDARRRETIALLGIWIPASAGMTTILDQLLLRGWPIDRFRCHLLRPA